MQKANQPYVKIYENGILTNPIQKNKPYLSGASQKEGKKLRKSNNRKGLGLVVVKIGALSFMKYRTVKQKGNHSMIVHSVLCN